MSLPRESGGGAPKRKVRVKRAVPVPRPEVSVGPPKPQPRPKPVGVFKPPATEVPDFGVQQTARKVRKAILKLPHAQQEAERLHGVRHAGLEQYADAVKAANDAANAADKAANEGGYNHLAFVRLPSGSTVANYWDQRLHDRRAGLPGPLRAASEVGLNVIKEAIDIPAQAIPSTAHLIEDAVTNPRKALVDDTVKPAVEVLKHPTQHPLSLVLLGRGAEAAIGRTAGAAARSGLAGQTLRDAAALKREPLKLTGNLTEPRSYSKDVIEKAVQVAREKRKAAKGIDPNQASGKALSRALRRRVDEEVDMTESLRRRNREQVAHEHITAQPKHGKEAVPLIVEGTIRSRKTLRPDLSAELERLRAAHAELDTKGSRLQNEAQQKQVADLLANDKFLADPAPAFDAARNYIGSHGRASDELVRLGYLTADQVERAKLIPYAVRHMDAHWDPETHDLLRHGQPIANAEIRAHMKGGDTHPALELGNVGFMTHRLSPRNAYYVSSESRPLHYGTRTGQAVEHGTYDASPQALGEQAVRSQGLVDAINGVNRTINEFGLKKTNDRYFKNWGEAQQYAEELRHSGGPDLVPLRIAPFQGSRLLVKDGETLSIPGHTPNAATIKESLRPDSIREHLEELPQRLKDAAKQGDGEAVLIPRAVHKRLVEHAQKTNSTTFDKAFQVGTGQFRQTVLPLSVRWLFGNVAEAGMRLAAVGAFSTRAGSRVIEALRESNPEAAAAFESRALSGTHFSSVKRLQLHRGSEQFDATALEGTAHQIGRATHSAPGRAVIAGWHAYRDDVAFKFNRWFETQTQKAAVGKLARQHLQELGHSWIDALRMGDEAIKDLADGLQNSDAQVRYARYVDRVLGRYSKLGPTERRLMSDYTPFMAWYRNALVFIGRLPLDHPIKTGLLAGAYNSSADYRAKHGLGEFLPGDVRAPRFLQGALPVGAGKMRVEAFTPFGAVSDPLGTPADLVLPQGRTIANAAQGKDWKGASLSHGGGDPELSTEAGAILSAIASGFVPGVAAVGRIRSQGGEAFANPLKVVKPHGSSGRSGWSWGSSGGSSSGSGSWSWGTGGG